MNLKKRKKKLNIFIDLIYWNIKNGIERKSILNRITTGFAPEIIFLHTERVSRDFVDGNFPKIKVEKIVENSIES